MRARLSPALFLLLRTGKVGLFLLLLADSSGPMSPFSLCCSPIHLDPIPNPSSGPNPSIAMNPLRPPSSSSKQIKAGQGKAGKVRAGQGKRASAALDARFASAAAAPGAPADGLTSSAGESIAHAAATSPTLASLEAAGFPAWWSSSSRLGSSEGMYPPGGASISTNN